MTTRREDEDEVYEDEPGWDAPLAFALTPDAIMRTVFATAESVHTGWSTCVEQRLVVLDNTVIDEASGNHCRLAEQEYADDDNPDDYWRDWTIELRIGEVFVIAHWRARAPGSPADFAWCAAEAESAFVQACALIGRRVRRGILVDDAPATPPRASRTRH